MATKNKLKIIAGEYGFQAELLKINPTQSEEIIAPLILKSWVTERIPHRQKKRVIVKITKKGDRTECGSQKGHKPLNIKNKILAQIIPNRISISHRAQTTKRCCCVLHMQKTQYIGFVNIATAFDTTHKTVICAARRKKGIDAKYNEAVNVVFHNG